MKKFLAILAVAGTLAACNNASESTENKKDSIDSAASATKEVIDSSAEVRKDVVDSSAEVKKDALDKADSTIKADTTKKH